MKSLERRLERIESREDSVRHVMSQMTPVEIRQRILALLCAAKGIPPYCDDPRMVENGRRIAGILKRNGISFGSTTHSLAQ